MVQALQDIKVIDIATLFAGPMAATMRADFGAEVIKIEHPKNGDPVRTHGSSKNGVGLWWKMLARNKKSLTLYLGSPEGQEIFKTLIKDAELSKNDLKYFSKIFKKFLTHQDYVLRADFFAYEAKYKDLRDTIDYLNPDYQKLYNARAALFTNTVNNPVYNKYKLSMPKYSLANLTTIQSLINTDYDEKIRIKETEKEEYNTIIKENISTMILTGIDSNFMINSLSNTLNGLNNTFTRTDIIRNLNTLNTLLSYYINSNINYKKAITFEIKQLLRIIPLLKNVEQSFINYSKAKIGISQTIDPALLNIEYIIH